MDLNSELKQNQSGKNELQVQKSVEIKLSQI